VRFHLVYRSSPGESTSKQRPTFYSKDLALASRLSYFIWSGPPDAELLALANAGNRLTIGLQVEPDERFKPKRRAEPWSVNKTTKAKPAKGRQKKR
jgi:hypothetical protein